MADIRTNSLPTTASSTASDDFIAVDGATNGTRKLNAYSPSFGGNATVAGTLTVSGGSVTLTGAAYSIFYADGSSGGNFTIRKAGVAYGTLYGNETNTVLDSAGSANLILQTGGATRGTFTSSGLTVNATTASTSTSTGALVVSGGVGVAGASWFGSTLVTVGTLWNSGSSNISTNGFNDATNIASNVITLYGSTGSTNIQKAGKITTFDGGSGYYGLSLQAPTSAYPNFSGAVNFTEVLTLTSQNATFAGTLTVSGNTNAFGAGGTGGANSQLILEGGSAANGGGAILYRKNGTVKAYAGMQSSILGGGSTSDNYIIYTSSGLALTVAGQQVQANATTASTSTSTGALVVSGGVGVAGAVYAGGKVVVNGGDAGSAQFAVASASGTLVANLTAGSTTNQSFGVRMFAGTSASDYGLFLRNVTDTTTLFKVDGVGGTTIGGSVTTAAPAGGTAAAWKLGTVASVSPTSPNRTIEVDIGGTIYYIHAKTTNN